MAPPIGQQNVYAEEMDTDRISFDRQGQQRRRHKSTRSYKSYTGIIGSMGKRYRPDSSGESSSAADSYGNWQSERFITSDKSTDGIEVFMNSNGDKMELMHVAGTKNYHRDTMPLTLLSQPTLQVSFMKMSTNYHPACDYATSHRVPTTRNKVMNREELTQEEKLYLLESHDVIDEESATRDEIHRNLIEMRNLENERDIIDRKLKSDSRLACHRCSIPNCHEESCINTMLDQTTYSSSHHSKSKSFLHLDWDFTRYLQRRRGFYFHASFDDSICRETFVDVCGGNINTSTKIAHPSLQQCSHEPFHVEKVAARAVAVRHVALTKGKIGTSFFISKDDGNSYHDDGLPQRLIDRLKKEKIISYTKGDIRYLVCGPRESYYVQLVSGQSLWSICAEDEEFRTVVDTFDVSRVAFGSFTSGPSWIVIGQDGKVAWRNLPCRLNMLLSKRTSEMAAPSEVSLGEYGSYFIRFLDGEIDYCLPAHIAASCQEIWNQGADITNIALHPEVADAFIIRHTQLP